MANYSPYDYNYGDFADYQMPETEEERQRRLAAEAAKRTPVKQVITTDPETGQQTMTISGDVRDLGPENTLTPTVYGAGQGSQAAMPVGVDTGALFNRMIQQESGGQQYDRRGKILTSPKGALGVAQIMPATALNPGYGVRPASIQEISTPEGNRAFGERYYQGLLNYFGGDVTKATAAYNGGPGRVSRNAAANAGQLNVTQLPAETQQYLSAVRPTAAAQPVVTAAQLGSQSFPMARGPAVPESGPADNVVVMTPSMLIPPVGVAAAQPVETVISPAAPAADTGVRPGAVLGAGGTATQEGAAGEAAAQQAMVEANNRFVAAQERPENMVALAQDSAAQPWLRALARDQVVENLTQAREKEKATREVEAARQDPNALARMLQAKSSEQGSYAKAMLFSILGMEKSAADEAAKLGIGSRWSTVTDTNGRAALIKVRSDGVPMEGYDSTGRQLSSTDLVAVMGAGQRKLDIVGGTYVNDTTGEVGRVVTDKNTGTSYIQTDTGRLPMAGFRPQGSGGTLDMQRVAAIQKQNIDLAGDWAKTQMRIQGAGPEAANKYIGEFNAKYGTNFSAQQLSGPPPQIDMTTGRMTVGATAVAPAAAAAPGTVMAPVAPAAPAAAAPAAAAPAAPAAAGVSGAAPLPGSPAAAAAAQGAVVPGGAARVSTAGKSPAQIVADQEAAVRAEQEARVARELALKEEIAKREAENKKRLALEEAEGKKPIEVSTAEQKNFVEKVIPEIQKKGEDGRFIADTRRTQVGMLTGPNSAIMGIYRGSGSGYDKARAVIRDAVAGAYSGQEGGIKLSEDLRGISIPEQQLSALREFAQLNTGINAKTLAENAGEGPKSDADMKLNQQANMSNIGDLPAFAALSGLTRSQFAGDINKRKQDFLNSNREQYKTQSQLEGAWSKEKDLLNRQYESIYRARLNYIDAQMVQKFGQDWRKKPNNDTVDFYRNASIHSFNVLPTPNYDPQTMKFVYPTQQSKIAAMRAITGR